MSIAVVLITILPLSYPLYYLSKIPVCLAAAYYCHRSYQKDKAQNSHFWYFLLIAILFNPVLPVHLFFSPLWIIADVVVAIYFYRYLKTIH